MPLTDSVQNYKTGVVKLFQDWQILDPMLGRGKTFWATFLPFSLVASLLENLPLSSWKNDKDCSSGKRMCDSLEKQSCVLSSQEGKEKLLHKVGK